MNGPTSARVQPRHRPDATQGFAHADAEVVMSIGEPVTRPERDRRSTSPWRRDLSAQAIRRWAAHAVSLRSHWTVRAVFAPFLITRGALLIVGMLALALLP